jgi:hypothetical protein
MGRGGLGLVLQVNKCHLHSLRTFLGGTVGDIEHSITARPRTQRSFSPQAVECRRRDFVKLRFGTKYSRTTLHIPLTDEDLEYLNLTVLTQHLDRPRCMHLTIS